MRFKIGDTVFIKEYIYSWYAHTIKGIGKDSYFVKRNVLHENESNIFEIEANRVVTTEEMKDFRKHFEKKQIELEVERYKKEILKLQNKLDKEEFNTTLYGLFYQKKNNICCENEDRTLDGGCKNCGDPSY